MTGEDIRNGNALTQLAKFAMYKGVQTLGRPTVDLVHSICVTGPACDIMLGVVEAINGALDGQDIGTRLVIDELCPGDPTRARWVRNCIGMASGGLGEIDVVDSIEKALDDRETSPTRICDGFIGAYSGRELSRLRAAELLASSHRNTRMQISKGKESTEDHVQTTARCIQVLAPEWFLLHDTDKTAEGDDTHMDALLSRLADLGYDTQPILADSAMYGLPQSCVRRVIVGVLVPGRRARIDSYDNVFRRLVEVFRSFQMRPPDLEDALLDSGSDAVRQALSGGLEALIYY